MAVFTMPRLINKCMSLAELSPIYSAVKQAGLIAEGSNCYGTVQDNKVSPYDECIVR